MERLSASTLEVMAEVSVTENVRFDLMHGRERSSLERRMQLLCSSHSMSSTQVGRPISSRHLIKSIFAALLLTVLQLMNANSALAQETNPMLSVRSTSATEVALPERVAESGSKKGAVYLVGYGDSLTIDVWAGQSREKNLSGTYFVFSSGHIEVPLLGKVNVGGKSLESITDGITKMLATQYIVEPHVSVSIKEYGSQTIHVLGSVDRPGSFPLKGPMSLAEAIANAQGTDPNQKGDKEAKVIRNDGTMVVIDLNTMFAAGEGNISLRGGDVVYVTAGHFVVVNGVVKKPGTVPWRDGMTITEAIAEAGGMQREANTRSVYIIRGSERIPVNVRGILQGKAPDIKLVSGDKVFVEQSLW